MPVKEAPLRVVCRKLKEAIEDEEKAAQDYRKLSIELESKFGEAERIIREIEEPELSPIERQIVGRDIETIRKISDDEQRHKELLEKIYNFRCPHEEG